MDLNAVLFQDLQDSDMSQALRPPCGKGDPETGLTEMLGGIEIMPLVSGPQAASPKSG